MSGGCSAVCTVHALSTAEEFLDPVGSGVVGSRVMRSADLFDLSGKVAIITGGTGGIGVVFAEALCTAGASVVVASRNGDNAARVASVLERSAFHFDRNKLLAPQEIRAMLASWDDVRRVVFGLWR